MQVLRPDACLAELVFLDVLDLRLDGAYALNEGFLAQCRAEYAADPSRFDEILPALLRNRALERGVVALRDVRGLVEALLAVVGAEDEA